MIDFNGLTQTCLDIAKKRTANGGAGNDYLKHCATEIVEATAARAQLGFWQIAKSMKIKEHLERAEAEYADELADIIICAMLAAAADNLDIEKALLNKIAINEKRAMGIGDKL